MLVKEKFCNVSAAQRALKSASQIAGFELVSIPLTDEEIRSWDTAGETDRQVYQESEDRQSEVWLEICSLPFGR